MADYLTEAEIRSIKEHVKHSADGTAPQNRDAYESPDFWIGKVEHLLEHISLLQKDIDEKEEWDYTGEW